MPNRICDRCGAEYRRKPSSLGRFCGQACYHAEQVRHGHVRNGRKSRVYMAWSNMIERCRNPNHPRFQDWGGRGIRVCERWSVFENFLSDMGEPPNGLEIDRIDNDGNYEPGNCRWTDRKTQMRNTRVVRLTADIAASIRDDLAAGKSQHATAKRHGVSRWTVHSIFHGKRWND